MSSGIIAALDVGERRIGVALASTIAKFPAPHTTIDRQVTLDAHAWIKDFANEQSLDTIVVGLPRGMDGQDTQQTNIAREFADELSKQIDIPVVMQDEAVTSVAAEERLKSKGKPYTKADIDAEAASIILQDYLNGLEYNNA